MSPHEFENYAALKKRAMDAWERKYLMELKARFKYVNWAAHAAGMDPGNFRRKLKKFGINWSEK